MVSIAKSGRPTFCPIVKKMLWRLRSRSVWWAHIWVKPGSTSR